MKEIMRELGSRPMGVTYWSILLICLCKTPSCPRPFLIGPLDENETHTQGRDLLVARNCSPITFIFPCDVFKPIISFIVVILFLLVYNFFLKKTKSKAFFSFSFDKISQLTSKV